MLKLLESGGWVIWLLVALSVISLSVIIYIYLHFKLSGISKITQHAILQGDNTSRFATELARIITSSQHLQNKAMKRESLIANIFDLLNQYRSGFRILEVIASTAPLLGLLGTVLGMIEAFQELAIAGNEINASTLSAGIWKALLTTAAGLIVAVPTLAAWHYFDRYWENMRIKVNKILYQIEV